jgi:hypothetical protein
MFDLEMKFENVIQKDFKIDVFVARDRVVHVSKVKRACEARWKQTLKKIIATRTLYFYTRTFYFLYTYTLIFIYIHPCLSN